MTGDDLRVIIPLIFTFVAIAGFAIALGCASDERKREVTRAGEDGRAKIKRAWIVNQRTDSNVSTKTGSAVGRGLVGGALLGLPGVVVGAGSAKKQVTQGDTYVTFLVQWDNDTERKVKCKMGDKQYCNLIKYVGDREHQN